MKSFPRRARSGGAFADWLHARMPKGLYARAAAHRHPADGAAAIGRRLCVHGAPLGGRDLSPLGRGRAPGHRGDHRHLPDLPATTPATASCDGSRRSISTWSSRSCPRSRCRRPLPKLVVLAARQGAVDARFRASRCGPIWIDTAAGQSRSRSAWRSTTRRCGCSSPHPRLCVELLYFLHLDGDRVDHHARRRDLLPAQPDQADPARSPMRRKSSARAATSQFSPRGAREVRQAGDAFLEMKRRVERAIEQRTTMLNGV